jgi:N-acetyl-anhydromuramyl-L-alanine amidase AmpD
MRAFIATTELERVTLPALEQVPSPNRSGRRGARVDLLVWHETAGSYAGAVRWLCTPTVYDAHGNVRSGPNASAHLVIDEHGRQASQLVPLEVKAWHAADFNPRSIGVEHANTTAKGYATERQLRVSARVFGWLCVRENIPPRWARGGHGPGVCYHGELGAAGGGHPQCGPEPQAWQRFLEYLHHELERGHFRKTWAR